MEDSVFSFEDFLGSKKIKSVESNLKEVKPIEEKVKDDTIDLTKEPIKETKDDTIDSNLIDIAVNEKMVSEELDLIESNDAEVLNIQESEIQESENKFYTLYRDKPENFSCDIYVEGAKTDETITRLIVETEDWTIMFPGQIKNGKVDIPIKKLSIFEEGQIGKIKLEVIAEGTVFIPWEDQFKIKLSKKVTVSMNENKKQINKKQTDVGIKVNVIR